MIWNFLHPPTGLLLEYLNTNRITNHSHCCWLIFSDICIYMCVHNTSFANLTKRTHGCEMNKDEESNVCTSVNTLIRHTLNSQFRLIQHIANTLYINYIEAVEMENSGQIFKENYCFNTYKFPVSSVPTLHFAEIPGKRNILYIHITAN